MALLFDTFYTDGLAQLSYMVGDTRAGVAAVIDPRRDVDVYVQAAQARGVRISSIVETHIHADFVSGSLELQARTAAPIYGGKSQDYRFAVKPLAEGDVLTFGSCVRQVVQIG